MISPKSRPIRPPAMSPNIGIAAGLTSRMRKSASTKRAPSGVVEQRFHCALLGAAPQRATPDVVGLPQRGHATLQLTRAEGLTR
jgi:hypothetical protein